MSKAYIKTIVEGNDTLGGVVFNWCSQAVILISLIAISIETLPNNSSELNSILSIIETITILLFTIEYILRIFVADKPIRFILSFYGIVDFLAVLPFYVNTGIDLRSIRIFRFFRLFQLLKLIRYNNAIQRFINAFTLIKSELTLFVFASLMLLFLSSLGIFYFENSVQPEIFKSVFHSLWWSIITLTTVGYGDMYPITTGGKIFTSVISLIGIGVVAVPTGLFASALSETVKQNET